MRHRVKRKKLSRTKDHRKALIRNLSRSLILEGKVETTLAKAKFVKPYVEKLVTKAKKDSGIKNINNVNSKLNSTDATRVLFKDLVAQFKDRNGGYTRITKLGFRDGDKAPMAKIEWVSSEAGNSKKESKVKVSKKDAEDEVQQEPIVVDETTETTTEADEQPVEEGKEENESN